MGRLRKQIFQPPTGMADLTPLRVPSTPWNEDEAVVLLALTDSVQGTARECRLPESVVARLAEDRLDDVLALRQDFRKLEYGRYSRLLTVVLERLTGWAAAWPRDTPPELSEITRFREAAQAMIEIRGSATALLPPHALETVWAAPGPEHRDGDKRYVAELMREVLEARKKGESVPELKDAEAIPEEKDKSVDAHRPGATD